MTAKSKPDECASPGCTKRLETKLACPKCAQLNLTPAHFCCQECFKSNYSSHKTIHEAAIKIAAFTTEWKKPENERNAMEYHHAETNEKEVTEEQSMTSELKMREMKRKEELVEGAIDREMKRKQQSQLDGDCQMDRNPQLTKTVEKQRLKFDLQNSQQLRELKSLLEEQEHPLRTKLRMSEGGIELTMEREQDERISVEKQRLKFDLQKSQQLLAIKNLTFLTCPGDKVNKIDALQMSRLIMVKNYCGILDLIKSLIKDYKDQKDTCSVEIENLCYGILNNACTLLLEVKEIANGPNGITIGPS